MSQLFSILLMVFGGLTLANVFKYRQIYQLSTAPIGIIIAVAVFLFLLTFLGCCGAFMENSCMLMTVGGRHCNELA